MNVRRMVGCLIGAALMIMGAATWRAQGATALPHARVAGFMEGINTVAVDGYTGRVFLTDARADTVRVLVANTGALLRTVAVGQGPEGVAVDTRSNRVFIADAGSGVGAQGHVSVLDAASGTMLRSVMVGSGPMAVAVDEATRRVFVLAGDGVSVLDARTGALVRAVPLGPVSSPAVLVDARLGYAFVTSAAFNSFSQPIPGANAVTVLDAASGVPVRRLALRHGPIAVAVDERTGRLFSANFDGTVSMLDVNTGRVVRTTSLSPLSVGNAVAVDGRTGRVFVSDYNLIGSRGHISILDARSGILLRTIAVGNEPTSVTVAESIGRVFTISGSGVTMLDARTGRPLRTIRMRARALAVDEQTKHVFVSVDNGRRVGIIDASSGSGTLLTR